MPGARGACRVGGDDGGRGVIVAVVIAVMAGVLQELRESVLST